MLTACGTATTRHPGKTSTYSHATTGFHTIRWLPLQHLEATATLLTSNPNLILATTTSTQDSGLLDVLIPLFEQESGYKVQTVAVGSGQAMTMGQQGNADVLLVHSPAAEVAFMTAGWGKDRVLVMHNDFHHRRSLPRTLPRSKACHPWTPSRP
jgi:ABC-type tungstate transport system permease subunit